MVKYFSHMNEDSDNYQLVSVQLLCPDESVQFLRLVE